MFRPVAKSHLISASFSPVQCVHLLGRQKRRCLPMSCIQPNLHNRHLCRMAKFVHDLTRLEFRFSGGIEEGLPKISDGVDCIGPLERVLECGRFVEIRLNHFNALC